MASGCKLAVIIPCYNYAGFVGHAIASVLSQGEGKCDLVVVDDSSTDGSWDLIASLVPGRCLRVPNGGPAKACVAAAASTDATHVLVLDADDELAPGAIDRILSVLGPGVSKVQFSLDIIDAKGRITADPAPRLADFRGSAGIVAEMAATGSYTNPPTSGNVFRRDVFDLLAEVDYDRYVDGATLFAAPFMGEVVSISDSLGRYRVHGGNASGLGAALDPRKLRTEVQRFASRLAHVRRALLARGIPFDLPRPEDTFFHRERSLYATVAEGGRPSPRQVARMQAALLRQPMSAKRKAAVAALAAATMLLPADRAKAMLAYRLNPGHRSVRGLLSELVRPGRRATAR